MAFVSNVALKQLFEAVQKELTEKDAMIDWLVDKLISNAGLVPVEDWRKAAQEAVKKMPSYCEEQYIHALEKKVKEQAAMIDWLAEKLVSNNIYFDPGKQFSIKGYTVEANKIVNAAGHCQLWCKAAQEAVKKNDNV